VGDKRQHRDARRLSTNPKTAFESGALTTVSTMNQVKVGGACAQHGGDAPLAHYSVCLFTFASPAFSPSPYKKWLLWDILHVLDTPFTETTSEVAIKAITLTYNYPTSTAYAVLVEMEEKTTSSWMRQHRHKQRLVGNLPYQTTEDAIGNHFSQAGNVTNVRIVYDRETGRTKGFGFCEFSDEAGAQNAEWFRTFKSVGAQNLNATALSSPLQLLFCSEFHHAEEESKSSGKTTYFESKKIKISETTEYSLESSKENEVRGDEEERAWKFFCWNVAGLRACAKRRGLSFQKNGHKSILAEDADVIFLGETKCNEWPVDLESAFRTKARISPDFISLAKEQRRIRRCCFAQQNKAVEDLANPDSNRNKTAGFTDQERGWFTRLLGAGFKDTYRELHGDKQEYTFWSYMGNARSRNIGWRLDYYVVSDRIFEKVKSSEIRTDVMGSDHAPVVLEIDI
ncbi:putative exodeoxyribonuclease III, partial [Ostertagia ostertagi]